MGAFGADVTSPFVPVGVTPRYPPPRAHIKPDRFADIQHAIGILASEEFMAQLAELLRAQLTPTDLCGRFGGNGFLIMLERGTARAFAPKTR